MRITDKIYAKSPVFIQNIGISLYGLYWKKRRYGGVFKNSVGGFIEREGYTLQQWRDYQTIEVRKLLVHAFDTVPFYNEKYRKAGFNSSLLAKIELEHLPKLPLLTKDELRKYGTTSLISRSIKGKYSFFSSSGSTGTPTKILFTHRFHQEWMAAIEARVRYWAGINFETARGMIGGRRVLPASNDNSPFYRYNFAEKQAYFSAYHISPKNVSNYLEGIIKHNVQYMTGYAASNFFLANMFNDLNLETPTLKAVITSSEKLTKEMRALFQKVYNCRTYDSYSGVEACGLISETKEGQLLFSQDTGILEVIDSQEKVVAPGATGEVVLTGLLNYDQPLIRYRIGDEVTLAADQVTLCGRSLPVIDAIVGRTEDKVIGKDGRQIVRFHSLFIDIPYLLLAQVIQNTYEDFDINVVVEEQFNKKCERIIKQRLISQIGPVNIRINKLDEIPKNNNGKFQAVISMIK